MRETDGTQAYSTTSDASYQLTHLNAIFVRLSSKLTPKPPLHSPMQKKAPAGISFAMNFNTIKNDTLWAYTVVVSCAYSDIHDGKCKTECDLLESGYDGGDCADVPSTSSCPTTSNGVCDMNCNYYSTNWDHGDCCGPSTVMLTLNLQLLTYIHTVHARNMPRSNVALCQLDFRCKLQTSSESPVCFCGQCVSPSGMSTPYCLRIIKPDESNSLIRDSLHSIWRSLLLSYI